MNNDLLKFDYAEPGFARVYYTLENLRYCFQELTPGRFETYRCSKDGEPSYNVKLSVNQIINLTKPEDNSRLVREFWEFIQDEQDRLYDLTLKAKVS